MKSFFGICVLSALVAVGTTQPTHNSPHDVWQTQHQMQPEHHMSQREDRMSQPKHYPSQPEHYPSQPEHYPSQPQHHMSQTEHRGSQPNHYSQPQHGFESWSNAEAQALAQSQRTWSVPEQPHYQPVEILSQPINPAQPHSPHSQPLPIDPQFELHPYPYQHPHYPPMGSHHSQDLYPTHGWNMQNPAVYENPLPEAPEHRLDSFKEDYPNQSSAFANAEASSNSEPIFNNESSNPQHFKILSIPKEDDGAEYILPVADHETRGPRVVHMSNDEGLPDIVKEILAKYRETPIKIKPKAKPDNTPKERKPEGYGPVHRPHKHIKHKIPSIPVVTKPNAKTEAVAVAKTDTDKTFTIVTRGKHRAATKAPRKHLHKHAHKKQLKPLLDPELLAKELQLLSKELWHPSPDKTHEKDIPCDDNPIVTDPDDPDCEDESNSLDKNKPKDKHHHGKHSDPHLSAATTPENVLPEKTTTASTYIESDDKKDQKDNDTDCDTCYDDNTPQKEDKRKNHEHKPIINEKQNTDSKPVDLQIENKDLKEKEVLVKKQLKKEFIKEEKKEKIEQYVPELKQYTEKPNSKIDQKDAVKNYDRVSPSPDEVTEPCDYDPKIEKKGKKHDVLIPKTDVKPKHDLNNNKPKNIFPHDKHSHPHTPIIIGLEKDIAKTTTPSSNVKPDQNDGDQDNDCDSTNCDGTTENCDTESTPKNDDGRKKPLPKPKTDRKNTEPKPVDNKKNTDTIIDHTIVHKKEFKKETSKVEIKELEKNKPKPEISVKNQTQDTPVNNDCDSTEVSVTNLPNHDNKPASEHKEEVKPLPKPIKDGKKPVSPQTGKEDKHTTITKKEVKKVEQTKKLTQKVETEKKDQINQTIQIVPEPKKYNDKLKPEKQENKYPDIEDSDSTESSEGKTPLDKTPSKVPLPKGNENSKDLTKEKKKFNKKEVTAKVEIKTKKSIKKVASTESVDESKSVETSNENSSIDDCDSANSETEPKPDKTKIIKEKIDEKKKKTKEVTKKTATIAKNKAESKVTGQELTRDEVTKILEKTEKTDQPLSTLGFLISLISHALHGSDSVKQMFEEPKVKVFMNDLIPLFHGEPKK